jgi:hypothetical protein
MTRSDRDPASVAEGLRLLTETLNSRRAPNARTDDANQSSPAEDAWRRATRDAARKLCADAGRHQYRVRGALTPSMVECSRCNQTWKIN